VPPAVPASPASCPAAQNVTQHVRTKALRYGEVNANHEVPCSRHRATGKERKHPVLAVAGCIRTYQQRRPQQCTLRHTIHTGEGIEKAELSTSFLQLRFAERTWFAVMAMAVIFCMLGRAGSAPAANSSFTASGP
jgi:hypothetical protein